jgi:hypothetical protein
MGWARTLTASLALLAAWVEMSHSSVQCSTLKTFVRRRQRELERHAAKSSLLTEM